MAAGCQSQGLVLNSLKLIYGRIAGVGRPDCSSIIDDWLDIGLVRAQHHFLLTSPARASQGAERAEFLSTGFGDFGGVGAEVEVGIKVDSKDARAFVERDGLTADEDLRMDLRLPGLVGSEKSNGAFIRCDAQHLRRCPGDDRIDVSLEACLKIGDFHRRATEREVVRV